MCFTESSETTASDVPNGDKSGEPASNFVDLVSLKSSAGVVPTRNVSNGLVEEPVSGERRRRKEKMDAHWT